MLERSAVKVASCILIGERGRKAPDQPDKYTIRDAGLGEFGKHGLLITKEFGPSVRLAAVLTDIENLPFNNSDRQAWIKIFCDSCNACVRKCPAKAIYKNPVIFEKGSEQHIDYKKCAVPFSKQHGCTVC